MTMTWLQLFNRIGKQPLRLTKNKDVTIKIGNEMHKCKIVYTDNGNDWYLEIEGLKELRTGIEDGWIKVDKEIWDEYLKAKKKLEIQRK